MAPFAHTPARPPSVNGKTAVGVRFAEGEPIPHSGYFSKKRAERCKASEARQARRAASLWSRWRRSLGMWETGTPVIHISMRRASLTSRPDTVTRCDPCLTGR